GFSYNSILKTWPVDKIIAFTERLEGIERQPQNMSVEQMLEMRDKGGFTLGAHTQHHPILSNETPERSKAEIIQSVEHLTRITGKQVIYFAYPNGLPDLDFGERELRSLEEAGIQLAFTCEYSFFSNKHHALRIPRMEISAGGP